MRKMQRVEMITKIVAEFYGVEYFSLFKKTRETMVRKPRQVAQYLIRKHTGMPYTAIGKFFYQNHATPIHSEKQVQDDIDTNRSMRSDIHEIRMIMSQRNLLSTKIKTTRKTCKPRPMEFIRVQAA